MERPTPLLPFRDRADAARQLAQALDACRGQHPLVLAIPRGAVPMGRILADALQGDLDVVLVRKLGAPGNPEFAVGAIDERGTVWLAPHAARSGADPAYVERESARQLALIRERRARYRGGAPSLDAAGRIAIVVDDGLATGATMAAALRAVRAQGPARLICAVPVAAPESLAGVGHLADEVVCLAQPPDFYAVGAYYLHFPSIDDDMVAALLARPLRAVPADEPAQARAVRVPTDGVVLEGDLRVPAQPRGLVLFAHGSGSSRHSPRNRSVAEVLNAAGIATLLLDLLTPGEDRDRAMRFDIPLLTARLGAALAWARAEPTLRALPLGLFGASTGAAAALATAATHVAAVAAVVSRGGRPDLASAQALAAVRAPTLLIVGAADVEVLALNRQALARLQAPAELVVVPGATHLFEEPGTLAAVARQAAAWFGRWFAA
ncbi:MAG: phosphoribosyltransferase family protein [Mizugakiibacter sp.]|uniref:phosphoribosyltransferase family protein n=1 Tax=Mizugakiibacter sp. TaxID=1972610 RepID=UPI0031C67400|nr:dienelactone hydrolase family protein [Xanthomonadaceae bacterium]